MQGTVVESSGTSKGEGDFEPKVIAFCCNWCAYGASDLVGVSRIQYPANIRIIRVMCTGRFDPSFALRAFQKGADGVLICGCHPGLDCHYVEGNVRAKTKIDRTREMLTLLGFEPERFQLHWISASEAQKFVQVMTDFVALLHKLGPNPLGVSPK
jgi:F420-non-reducing hydrogenase iron-sulfur subunit